jgi:glycogen operon protein
MTEADWTDHGQQIIGAFMNGGPLRSSDRYGQQIIDHTFLLWFNAGPADQSVLLPENPWVRAGEVVVSTDPDHPVGTQVAVGDEIVISGRSVVVIRSL